MEGRRPARRMLTVLAAVAVLPPVGGAQAPGDGQAASGAERAADPIQSLLDRRAEAILTGDEEAFMGTVDRSGPRFVRRQRLLFRGFQQLGLAGYRLEVGRDVFPELTTRREVRRYGASLEPTVLHVEERYRIEGYDRTAALEDLFLTFVRRPGGWRVASDTDLDDLTLHSGRKLWELGPIVTRESEHFLYVSHPGLAGEAERILETAERALARVRERWPLPWSERVVILAPGSTEELRRIIQATFDLDVFVAFAYSGLDRSRHWQLAGHRIILNWPNFSRHPAARREGILAHELLHVATRDLAGPMTPVFVDEGVAEWVAGDRSVAVVSGRVREGTWDRKLPEDHEFVAGEGPDIAAAYEEAFTSMRYAAERFGPEAVGDLYRDLGSLRLAPGTWRYHVGRSMRAAFGIDFGTFQRDWAERVRETYG